MLQCCSSSTSSSQLSYADQNVGLQIESDGGKLEQQVEYLVCEYGWMVRRLIENKDETRQAAQVQAEAFHIPVALFNDLFFQFFQVLSIKEIPSFLSSFSSSFVKTNIRIVHR